jgi:hypothetical protein
MSAGCLIRRPRPGAVARLSDVSLSCLRLPIRRTFQHVGTDHLDR